METRAAIEELKFKAEKLNDIRYLWWVRWALAALSSLACLQLEGIQRESCLVVSIISAIINGKGR